MSDTSPEQGSVDGAIRRPWESMSLTEIGTFGDVLRGNTGPLGDGGGTRKKAS